MIATLPHVLPAALDAVGLPVVDGEIDSAHSRKLLGVPCAKRAVVVLVDGLGFHNLEARLGHAPNLRALTREKITTVTPSTTAAGITAFGTGLLPGKTAMAGYALRSPRSGEVFSLISWNERGLRPETWQTEPTLFERLGDRVDQTRLIQPKKFAGSGLTLAALRGARTVPAEKLDARVDAALRELKTKQLVYLYWGDIDSAGHHDGWTSERWTAELEHFDAEFGRLLRAVPRDTLVLLTADHGMVDVEERIEISTDVKLAEGVEVVAGESRAVHLYTDEAEAVASRWRDRLGGKATVYTKTEFIASGLLGPVNDFTAKVIGDVLAFAHGNTVLVDSRFQSSVAIGLKGVHGSLSDQEVDIPLVVVL